MGGQEPARHLQDADHRRGCAQFTDDHLPVPVVAVLPRDRWRRRTDPGRRAERARDFPQKPVYLIGTGESVETAM
jgi:hypothetical protein